MRYAEWDIRHGGYQNMLKSESADLILTSPPYNIGSKSKKKTGGRRHGGYDSKSFEAIRGYKDSLAEDEYQQSQIQFLNWVATHLNQNGILAYNHKPRHKNRNLIHPMSWIAKCECYHW